jgi:hypothetical protein
MKVSSQVASHIDISYDDRHQPDFPNKVERALTLIKSGSSGNQLIDDLKAPATKGKRVTIRAAASNTSARPVLTTAQAHRFQIPDDEFDRRNNEKATELAQKRSLRKGEGSAATIDWNTDQGLQLREGVPIGVGDPNKAWLALAHEMIHARRITSGTYTGGTSDRYDPSSPAGKEELRAVGLDGKTPSENSIRAEHGEPLRKAYAAQAQPESDEDDFGRGGLTFRVSDSDSR